MDITEIILQQHEQQRQLFAQLEQFPRDDVEGLGAMWRRLAILLETHAEAEEKFFYPRLLEVGTGAADADEGTVEGEVKDVIEDHNEIREAVRAAEQETVGSAAWWKAVTDANIANGDHMAEEERQDLTDFRRNASLQDRHDLAVDFLRYMALEAAAGITPVDKDPEDYVDDPKGTMTQAAGQA